MSSRRPVTLFLIGLLIMSVSVLAGCAKYYMITDTASNKTYYTMHYKNRWGRVVFQDRARDRQMTIDKANVNIEEITKEKYRKNVNAEIGAESHDR